MCSCSVCLDDFPAAAGTLANANDAKVEEVVEALRKLQPPVVALRYSYSAYIYSEYVCLVSFNVVI